VYALNGATGAKKWEFLTGGWVFSSPAFGSDGSVYVGSYDRKVYAIASDSVGLMASSWPRYRSLNNSQGQTAPYTSIQPKTEGVAVTIGKRAVFEATVISQIPVNLQWSLNGNDLPRATNSIFEIPNFTRSDEGYYKLTATLADDRSVSSVFLIAVSGPEIVRQPLGGQFQEGTNTVLTLETRGYLLKYQWKRDGIDLPSATNYFLDLSVIRMTDAGKYTVTISNPIGSVVSQPAGIVVNRLSFGNQYWEFLTGREVLSSPAIGSDGTVYVGSGDMKVYALNGATGAKKWEFLTGDEVSSSPAIGSDGTVYVGSWDKKVYALNGATGSKKWEFLTGGGVFSSPSIGSDGTVYVASTDQKVYAIASSSEGLATSPWPKFRSNYSNTGKFPSGSGPLIIIYSPQSGLNLNIPISPDFDTILEYSTNLNQWSEQQRFGRQSNVPSIVVPLKMDQTKSMEYWRTRNQ
jgi:outer membrane protein assembly factor BamB